MIPRSSNALISLQLSSRAGEWGRVPPGNGSTYPLIGGISRQHSGTVNEHSAKIVDVGPGRPGAHEIAEPGEEAGGIVVGEKGGRIEAECPRPRDRAAIRERTGRIIRAAGPAVGAVGIARQRGNAGAAVDLHRERSEEHTSEL